MRVKRLLRLVAAVGILLALSGASAAMARPAQPGPAAAGDPVRFWSVSRVDEGAGEVPVGSGAQAGGKLQEAVDVGHVVFNLPLHAPYWYFLPRDRAFGSLFSSADGVQYSVLAQAPSPNPLRPGAPTGAITHLDEYQAYVKRGRDASLRITLSDALLQDVDGRRLLRHGWRRLPGRASARVAAGGGDVGGLTPSAVGAGPVRRRRRCRRFEHGLGRGDVSRRAARDQGPAGRCPPRGAVRRPRQPRGRGGERTRRRVGRAGVHPGRAASPARTDHDARPRAARRAAIQGAHAPAAPGARCPAGPRRHAGTLQFSDAAFAAGEPGGTAFVLVTRTGGSHGSATVTVRTSGGSAHTGADFTSTATHVTSPTARPLPASSRSRSARIVPSSRRSSSRSRCHIRCARRSAVSAAPPSRSSTTTTSRRRPKAGPPRRSWSAASSTGSRAAASSSPIRARS